MDVLYGFKAAVITEGVLHQSLKGLFLACNRHGKSTAKHILNETCLELVGVLGVEEEAVDVGAPVVEGGEQKAG